MVPSINRQPSVISEKDEQVLPSENISTSSGGKPVVSNEAPSQTVYAPPTFQHLPPKQSTIVGTVPTTPIITQVWGLSGYHGDMLYYCRSYFSQLMRQSNLSLKQGHSL